MPLPDESSSPTTSRTTSPVSRIVLVGFMGAGKSTVGALLARRLGWAFHDADAVLERSAGMSIAELFSRYGEHGFRDMETAAIVDLMLEKQAVIALGGGAIEDASTRSLLSRATGTRTVFLDAPLKILLERCQLSPVIRPLLQNRDSIPARYERRLPYYQGASITANTAGLTPETVVQILMERLQADVLEGRSEPQILAKDSPAQDTAKGGRE